MSDNYLDSQDLSSTMNNVFAKVFSQIFDSTIAEDYKIRHIFMDLLVMADSDGVIDKTPQAISRIANVPLERVNTALRALSQPDKASRTKDSDGRRIQLIDDKRDWGWRIVNFQKYREIRDEEARRIANRSYKREQRAREKASASRSDSQHSQPLSANTEVEVEVEVDKSKAYTRCRWEIPSIGEIAAYCRERGNGIDAQHFFDHYTSNGWKVGRNQMRDWRATVRTWEKNGINNPVTRRSGDGSVPNKRQQREQQVIDNQKAILDGLGFGSNAESGQPVVQGDASAGGSTHLAKVVRRGAGRDT